MKFLNVYRELLALPNKICLPPKPPDEELAGRVPDREKSDDKESLPQVQAAKSEEEDRAASADEEDPEESGFSSYWTQD